MNRIPNPPRIAIAQPDGSDWRLTLSVFALTRRQNELIRPIISASINIDWQFSQKPMHLSCRTIARQFETHASGHTACSPDEIHLLVHSLAHMIHDQVPECDVQVEAQCLGECLTVVLSRGISEETALAPMHQSTSFIEIEAVCFEPASLTRAAIALRKAQPLLNIESDLGSLTLRGWGDLAVTGSFTEFGQAVAEAIWCALGCFAIVLAYQYDHTSRMLDEQTYALPAYSAWLSTACCRQIPITWICGPDGHEPESIWTRRSLRPRARGL